MKKKQIEGFQIVRALCFGMIFLLHCHIEEVTPLVFWSVELFICMSGYLVGYYENNENRQEGLLSHSWHYACHKLRRLYPLHITLLIACGFLGPFASVWKTKGGTLPFWGGTFLMSGALVQSLYPKYYFAYNGVSWYLSSFFVLSFGTCLMLRLIDYVEDRWKDKMLYGLGILWAIDLCYTCFIIKGGHSTEYWLYICPLSRVCSYMEALLLGRYQKGKKMSSFVDKKGIFFLVGGVVLGNFLLWKAPLPQEFFRSGMLSFPSLLILLGLHRIDDWGKNGRFWKKGLLFLGNISGEMYLIHQVLLRWGEKLPFTRTVMANPWQKIVVFYFLTLLFACLWRWIFRRRNVKRKNEKIKAI